MKRAVTLFVLRVKRAWRAEFGPPQRMWARIQLPYPEVGPGATWESGKTLSFWMPIQWTAGSAHFEPFIDGVMVEERPAATTYVETQGPFSKRTMKVDGGYMEPNRGFETEAQP